MVEEAYETVGASPTAGEPGVIEPIPETQQEINTQASQAILDIFPRIPNTAREAIIEHSFQKVFWTNLEFPTCADSPSSKDMEIQRLG